MITNELNESIKFLVDNLHTVVKSFNGYDVIGLAKKGKLGSIIITKNCISYNGKDYSIKSDGSKSKSMLEVENIIIEHYRKVF